MLLNKHVGFGKSRAEYADQTINRIAQSLRDCEADLSKTRWFDYRFMTPAECTYLFAAHYRDAYTEAFKRTRDIDRSENVNAFTPADIFASKELTAMWQARQKADAIGCKYDFFLTFAFKRFEHRGWRFMPRANHLFAEELCLDIEDAWKTQQRASLQVATHTLYQKGADDLPEQQHYYEYLCKQVGHREHPHFALARLVYQDAVLPEHFAAERFSQATLQKAKLFAV